jgi:hypothetical protein
MKFQINTRKILSGITDYPFLGITITGGLIAQIIATFQVYYENLWIIEQIQIVKANGYIAVPNSLIIPYLKAIQTAFCGGLFFSTTIGLGITVLCYLLGRFWICQTKRNKYVLGCIFMQWIYALYQSNVKGWSSFSCYLIILAPVVFYLSVLIPDKKTVNVKKIILFWLSPIIIMLTIIYGMDRTISFISIRDYLLLSNRLGNICNDFYYRYTLYPSEMIKPFSLKQQKTCCIIAQDLETDQPLIKQRIQAVQQKCIENDYLVISDHTKADLMLVINKHHLLFQVHGDIKIKASIQTFLRKSTSLFDKFSMLTDVNEFFRSCIFLSLLFASPLVVYIFFMKTLSGLCQMINIQSELSDFLVISVACTILISVLITFPSTNKNDMVSNSWDQLFQKACSQNNWKQAVELLKIKKMKKNCQLVSKYLKQTDHPVLKYWMIRYLSKCHDPTLRSLFYKLLNDSQVNVVCQSLYALGRQRDRNSIQKILELIKSSNHWYIQMYAYRALKRAGWHNNAKKDISFTQ